MTTNESKPSAAAHADWTPTEQQLASIWAEVLAMPHVDRHAVFLDLGGESISATLCINRVRKIFNVNIPLSMLVAERSTLSDVAAAIDHGHRRRSEA